MAKIDDVLGIVKAAGATDLHLVSGSVPMVRLDGKLEKTRHRRLAHEEIKQLLYELLTDDQIRTFERSGDLDFAHGIPGVARFRVNVYSTMTGMAAAIRLIPDHPLDLLTLGFPRSVSRLAENRSGLVLVTGPTNSGKTTTLAAMVDYINANAARHIITLEDPIEYLHSNKNSLISQRQIGTHADSFASGLRAALREDPDVILVGEMRDIETISLAITAAEVGLLVMGTLHTCSAAATVDRLVDVFPADQQQQIRIMLADSISGIICQQLLRRADGQGRIVAYEFMTRSTSIASLIRDRKSHQIATAIQTGRKRGMQLFDNHVRQLLEEGLIPVAEAIRCANEPARFCSLLPSEEPAGQGV
jgi:twitching motility protein PilT